VRPPAESYATPPEPEKLVEVYEVFRKKLGEGKVELLTFRNLRPLQPMEIRNHGCYP